VRLAYGFHADVPRSKITSVRIVHPPWWGGIGAHMVGRRAWLVNTRRSDAVEVQLSEPITARVLGFPVKVERLLVGTNDPDRLMADLGR
jgi:hypothetical protein